MNTTDERDIWKAFGMETIENLAKTGREFTADDLYLEGLPAAPHPNMVGKLFRQAMSDGYIIRTGKYRRSTRKARKAGIVAEYRGMSHMFNH